MKHPYAASALLWTLAFLIGLPLTASAATIEGFVGYSSTQVAPNLTVKLLDQNGKVVMNDDTNFFGKYKIKGIAPGDYILQVGEVKRAVTIRSASEKQRQDIDLSVKGGGMDYSKSGREPDRGAAVGSERGAAAAAPNNATLQQQIAGSWWGYAGSTERRIGLCPDGSYQDYRESSYSGRDFDSGGYETGAWGAAGQEGGAGTWTIQGDTQSGTIHVRYRDGRVRQLHYSQIGDPGCLNIDGSKLCRESAQCR